MNIFEPFQPVMAIATTPTAARTLQPLCTAANLKIWVPELWADIPNLQVYEGSLQSHLQQHWPQTRTLVMGLAMGATVRLIAPLLTDKNHDPAVVVVDANGDYTISVCGGHRGGADQFALGLSALLQNQAVLTGASASAGWLGLDTLGKPFGWQRNGKDWTAVSALIARGGRVQVKQTVGSSLWQSMLPFDHPLTQFLDEHQSAQSKPDALVWIGCTEPPPSTTPWVAWIPRLLWIGIGCEQGSSERLIEEAIQSVLSQHNLNAAAIAGIASITLKSDEKGLTDLCARQSWPFFCYSSETLAAIQVPNPSEQVRAVVQTPSVAEAAALAAAHQFGRWDDQPMPHLLAPKTIHRSLREPGAVTVAIAQGTKEWIGKTGSLVLIGCGPGDLNQMTPAAQSALTQVEVVIGYKLYLDLVRSRFRPGQIIEASDITQERARAQRAICLASWGLHVAVISSGDSGIYGMAGLVLEELELQGWDGQTPAVEILPGISALQAAASRVGTPLMHDFCAISLSDLLTPWEVIESRLEAAAAADFITAIYNPRSKTRQTQLTRAQAIFLKHRSPETPVAIVKSAYRDDEETHCATLGQLHELDIDMLTLVLIGNQSTRLHHNWMITPRGYLGFR